MLVLLGKKLPDPPLQLAPVATVKPPLRVATGLFEQSVCAGPAFAVGAGEIVQVTWLLTGLHRPLRR